MNRSTPKIRELAECLIAYEGKGNSSQAQILTSFLVSEKLRPELATLMGNAGFCVLLSRALKLASVDVAWLRNLVVKPDGSLKGLDEISEKIKPEDIALGEVALVTHLLGLLISFIGEILTMRLLREVWPKLPLDDRHFGNGDKNEKTK